jgi:pyrimidine operon attenuation protein/uracil phosphoribosyltransferase
MARSIAELLRTDARPKRSLPTESLAIIGIRTGGAHLAFRLVAELSRLLGRPPPVGLLDITLYRDDVMVAGRNVVPVLRATEIPFAVDDKYLVLVDDVLFTGRTVRAALGSICDLGRPSCVRLAVLIDRGLRELPIAPDVVGYTLDSAPADHVEVRLVEDGASSDCVVLAKRPDRRGISAP